MSVTERPKPKGGKGRLGALFYGERAEKSRDSVQLNVQGCNRAGRRRVRVGAGQWGHKGERKGRGRGQEKGVYKIGDATKSAKASPDNSDTRSGEKKEQENRPSDSTGQQGKGKSHLHKKWIQPSNAPSISLKPN